jgi:hypothetical protein
VLERRRVIYASALSFFLGATTTAAFFGVVR